jgi:alkylation response protein AidB-like acyl-CoA dehydrogenase
MRNSVDLAETRSSFRTWIEENLPAEWRDLSHGEADDKLAYVRREWGRRLYAGGWLGVCWPVEYGGRALSMAHYRVVIEEQAAVGAPEPINNNSIAIFAPLLMTHGSEELRQRYLLPMLMHDEVWCQGFSEPGAGSDLAALSTRAKPDTGGWRLTGQKLWTTYGQLADYCYILVRTDSEAPKRDGITMMILDMRQPGVDVKPLRNLSGSAEFSEIFLDGAFVPDSHVVGPVNGGWRLAISALSSERGMNIVQRGLAMSREFDIVRKWAPGENTGSGFDPLIRDKLVDSLIACRAMRSVAHRLLDDSVTGGISSRLASVAKVHWSESHQELLRLGVEILGNQLNSPTYTEWVRAFLFSRAETIYAGTTEIQRNSLARDMGLPSGR